MSSIPLEARSPAWTEWSDITEAAMMDFKKIDLARKLILGVRAVEFYRPGSDVPSPVAVIHLNSFSKLIEYLSRDVRGHFAYMSSNY